MKGKVPNFNDGKLYITIPLMATSMEDLKTQVNEAKGETPDMYEWRADALVGIDKKETRDAAIKMVRELVGDTPVLFTCRDFNDRGKQEFPVEVKRAIIEDAVKSDGIDVVDVELTHGKEYITRLRELAHANGVLLLIAHHDWENTPSDDEMTKIIKEEYDMGADILKYAFQPATYGDIARIAETTLNAKKAWQNRPCFSIAGGEKGMMSRICGRALGTNLCFASIGKTMQVHIQDLRRLDKLMFG